MQVKWEEQRTWVKRVTDELILLILDIELPLLVRVDPPAEDS